MTDSKTAKKIERNEDELMAKGDVWPDMTERIAADAQSTETRPQSHQPDDGEIASILEERNRIARPHKFVGDGHGCLACHNERGDVIHTLAEPAARVEQPTRQFCDNCKNELFSGHYTTFHVCHKPDCVGVLVQDVLNKDALVETRPPLVPYITICAICKCSRGNPSLTKVCKFACVCHDERKRNVD